MSDQPEDQYDEAETARRRDEIIRRMINTPPKPHRESSPKAARKRGQSADSSADK